MATPRVYDWKLLKHVARYLIGAPRCVLTYKFGEAPKVVEGCTDSDWAGNVKDRRSTSGGMLLWGGPKGPPFG